MKYELDEIIEYVDKHPGETCAELIRRIRNKWIAGQWTDVSYNCLIWKLRYLELANKLVCKDNKWYLLAERKRQEENHQ